MKFPWMKYCIIFLLCLPVLFINIKSSHDWGDDFAQYIHQAINISNGVSQTQTGYIYNPQFTMLGPPAYPAGFPLLLLPVYTIFGNNIAAFDLYTSLFLIALAVLMFHFFQKHYSALISGLVVLIFIYNPWTLNFKMEIMSEIPFTLLLLFCVLLYQKVKPYTYRQSIILALSIGFLMSLRNVGVVFISAMLLDCFHQLYINRSKIIQKKYNYKKIMQVLIIALCGLFTYFLVNKWIFPCTSQGVFSYNYSCNSGLSQHSILNNITYNMEVFRSYFEPWNDQWQFVSIFSGTMIFAFVVLGMIKKMTEQFEFQEGLIVLYLIVIFIYPYTNAGFRFLFPIAPFLLYYGIIGIHSIHIKSRSGPNLIAIGIAIIILLSYQKGFRGIILSQNRQLQGPQEPESMEAFDYIIHHTPATARFDFFKPRALALYTGREAMSNRPGQTMSEINQSLEDQTIQYILVNRDISDDSLKSYVKCKDKELTMLWGNAKYDLYKCEFAYFPSSDPRIKYWENQIVNTEKWRAIIRQKAKDNNIPIDSMLYLDARYMLEIENKK